MVWLMHCADIMPRDDLRSELERPRPGMRQFAADRHRDLRAACDELLRDTDEPHRFATGMRELDRALRDHLAAEEDLLIPAFQISDPEEGDALRTEHARIRECLDEVAAAAPRSAHDLRRLAGLLDENRAHEDTTMYAWAEDHLPAVARRQLYVRISHWLRRT